MRGFNDIYWDNYHGSANFDIHVIDTAGGTPRRLTDTTGNERYPCFSADGKTIYFVAEEKGVANWYSMPLEGGARTPLTKYTGLDVHRPCLGHDRKTAVFELGGQLFTTDLTAPAEKPTPVKVAIEAAVRMGWDRFIGSDGIFIGMHGFGASGPMKSSTRNSG
ncbi:MAG: hypothetical protein HC813_03665 [Planctomycetes bacterium]|nr:hypothetical protein [Planctomycetota bacterium]